jgi:hypothetical protein
MRYAVVDGRVMLDARDLAEGFWVAANDVTPPPNIPEELRVPDEIAHIRADGVKSVVMNLTIMVKTALEQEAAELVFSGAPEPGRVTVRHLAPPTGDVNAESVMEIIEETKNWLHEERIKNAIEEAADQARFVERLERANAGDQAAQEEVRTELLGMTTAVLSGQLGTPPPDVLAAAEQVKAALESENWDNVQKAVTQFNEAGEDEGEEN